MIFWLKILKVKLHKLEKAIVSTSLSTLYLVNSTLFSAPKNKKTGKSIPK